MDFSRKTQNGKRTREEMVLEGRACGRGEKDETESTRAERSASFPVAHDMEIR